MLYKYTWIIPLAKKHTHPQIIEPNILTMINSHINPNTYEVPVKIILPYHV